MMKKVFALCVLAGNLVCVSNSYAMRAVFAAYRQQQQLQSNSHKTTTTNGNISWLEHSLELLRSYGQNGQVDGEQRTPDSSFEGGAGKTGQSSVIPKR